MKYGKILALLAVAAASMMAFAATASAEPTLTAPTGTKLAVGSTLHAETHNGHVVLKPEFLPAIECSSTVRGKITSNGTPASASVETLLFEPCTNSWHVTTAFKGNLFVNSAGTVISTGATVEATRFGVTCRYTTGGEGVDIGTLTDSHETGATATMHIHGLIPRHEPSSPLCGVGPTTWKGAYIITNPMSLYLD